MDRIGRITLILVTSLAMSMLGMSAASAHTHSTGTSWNATHHHAGGHRHGRSTDWCC